MTSTLLAAGTSPIFHLESGHTSHTLGPFGIVSDITFHPAPLIVLAAGTFLYLRAVRRVNAAGVPVPIGPTATAKAAEPGADPSEAGASSAATSDEEGLSRPPRPWIGSAPWPRWRTWSFLAAVISLAVATLSGLTSFERSSFIIVSVQYSLIVFAAPFFLSLAAPITLTLATVSASRAEAIRAAVTGRVAQVLTFPLVAAVIFGAWLFLVLTTPIFRIGLDHAALWQVINLLLLVTGCLFAWSMAAIDPLPKATGHGWRMLWLLLTLPYTTVLGMTLESETRPIARGVTSQELHTGGGILWTIGGFLGLFATILVLVSWCRLEERSAARRDRVLDPEAAAQLAYWRANRRLAAEEAGLIPRAVPEEMEAEVLALARGRRAPLALPSGEPPATPESE